MEKIIIDTDPGIDDAMAILFAAKHPQIELLGLTTIFGNCATGLATENALRVVEVAGLDIPVCHGEEAALAGPPRPYPTWVHGEDGLGDIGWPAPTREADPRHAVDFIAETLRAHPNEVTLVPVGPLTNIARLVELHPDVLPLAKEVVVMGGSALDPGNVTPLAEANVANDPEGADLVFGADWPVTMVGLDVTMRTTVGPSDFEEITAANAADGQFMERISAFYIDFYSNKLKVEGCCMHDVCAVALPLHRDLFQTTKARIRVETEGFCRGKTAVMPEGFFHDDEAWVSRPMQAFASGVDGPGMSRLFVDTLKKGS